MPVLDADQLRLTDFMDLPTLQEIQDSFAAVAGVKATITDAEGNLLTQPAPTNEFLRRQRAIAQSAEASEEGPQREGAQYVAPIIVNNHRLGTIRMTAESAAASIDEGKIAALAARTGLDVKQVKGLATQLFRARNIRPASIQFLFLIANAIARLCFQEYQLRRRIHELTAVYRVTMMMADARDLPKVLQRTVEVVAEVMQVKASSIRLLDDNGHLIIKAVHNLTPEYLNKGPIVLSKAEIDKEALSDKGYCYVQDMAADPRVIYKAEAIRDGIVSMLSVGMRYKGKPIGVLRVYTDQEQHFSQLQIDLLKAVAAQAAASIENARLLAETLEAQALEQQVQMAADVQQRMIPQTPPTRANADIASVYVPCFELGGDLFDFIPLADDNVGLVIADVAGKGVPASLIMASVRAALRAHVDNLYYLYEVIRRVNLMLYNDTKPSEFVTLFYGVLDTRNRRLTYCNAGHPPGMILRGGQVTELGGGNLVLGVDPDEYYRQEVVQLLPGDVLLLYTDGLSEAMNFQRQMFGRQRVIDALVKNGQAAAQMIADALLWDMRRFVGMTPRTDDVTMIVVKIL